MHNGQHHAGAATLFSCLVLTALAARPWMHKRVVSVPPRAPKPPRKKRGARGGAQAHGRRRRRRRSGKKGKAAARGGRIAGATPACTSTADRSVSSASASCRSGSSRRGSTRRLGRVRPGYKGPLDGTIVRASLSRHRLSEGGRRRRQPHQRDSDHGPGRPR